MDIKEFFDKYLGKMVDFDKQFGAQCVDLFRQYCQDVWEVPHLGGVDGAKDIFLNYEKMPAEMKYTIRVKYDGIIVPPMGAALVFDSSSLNKYGHIAINIFATKNRAIVLEQDGINQTGTKVGVWDYSRLLGWLEKKRGSIY